jgi:hypothetical protein
MSKKSEVPYWHEVNCACTACMPEVKPEKFYMDIEGNWLGSTKINNTYLFNDIPSRSWSMAYMQIRGMIASYKKP